LNRELTAAVRFSDRAAVVTHLLVRRDD
jgi:hypothetical protein